MKSSDGRRPGSTRAVRSSRGGRRRRSRPDESTTRARARRASRGASFDRRRDVRRVGLAIAFEKTTLEGGIGGSLASDVRIEGSESSRPRSAWGAVKHAVHPILVRRWSGGSGRAAERPFFPRIVDRSLDTYRVYGCPFRWCRWQTPIACTSGRVAQIAKAVRAA